jgi:hypothetical protein
MQLTTMLAKRAYNGVKYIKGLVNSEKHFRDFSSTDNIASSAWTVHSLCAIPIGDENYERTGNSVLLRGLNFKIQCDENASATYTTTLKIVCVRDKQQVGDTAPNGLDVFKSAHIDTYMANDQWGRFEVVFSKTVVLSAATGGGVSNRYISKFVPLQIHQRYNGPLAGDIQKNGYYLLLISNQSTNAPSVQVQCRTTFYDN